MIDELKIIILHENLIYILCQNFIDQQILYQVYPSNLAAQMHLANFWLNQFVHAHPFFPPLHIEVGSL